MIISYTRLLSPWIQSMVKIYQDRMLLTIIEISFNFIADSTIFCTLLMQSIFKWPEMSLCIDTHARARQLWPIQVNCLLQQCTITLPMPLESVRIIVFEDYGGLVVHRDFLAIPYSALVISRVPSFLLSATTRRKNKLEQVFVHAGEIRCLIPRT